MKPRIKHPKHQPGAHVEFENLAELVGEFIQYWGFKAVQGRMWCYLYLSKEPLSSIQLAQLLKISPALVTQSIQILLQYRVILESEKGPNGVLQFRANPDASEAIQGVLLARESVMLSKIEVATAALGKTREKAKAIPLDINSDRVRLIHQWTKLAQMALKSGLVMLAAEGSLFRED